MNTKSHNVVDAEEQFSELERLAESAYPGINDLLTAYGKHENALHQAEAYFSILSPAPRFTTSDGSI